MASSQSDSKGRLKATSLRRKADFHQIKINGKRRTLAPWVMFSYIANTEGRLRYGLTVSRKVGNAVLRNRLKRWCREFFRRVVKDAEIPELDINVVFRPMPSHFYKELEFSEFSKVFQKGFKSL